MTTSPSIESLTENLRRRLATPLPGPEAQRRMSPLPPLPGWAPDLAPDTARRAGALILIYPGAAGPSIALTIRRADLAHHASQISLPGGAIDPGETPLEAALRETREEIGVTEVEVLGHLSTLWIPVSNFVLAPFVAASRITPTFVPDPTEVADMLELPVAWLGDAMRRRWSTRSRRGEAIRYPYFDTGSVHLWGATAMVLAELAQVLDLWPSDVPHLDHDA